MAYNYSGGRFQEFDSSGDPLAGGKVYTYYAGTTTPLASYTTQAATTPNANPVILDSAGRASIWLGPYAYRIILKTSADVTVWDDDNVQLGGGAQVSEETFIATVGQTVFNISEFEYTPGNKSLQVLMNGLALRRTADYTETSATSFTLTTAAEAGDEVIARAGEDLGANVGTNASSITYDPSGAGAAATTVQAQLRLTIQATDFGDARGGVSDTSAILQAAIDAAETAGGGTVYCARGIWGIGATVVHKNNVRIVGEGRGITTFAALSSLDITDPMFEGEFGDTGFEVWLNENISYADATFDGGGRTYPAWDVNTDPATYGGLSAAASRGQMVKIVAGKNIDVRGCEFKNHHSNGALNLQGCVSVVIDGNLFHDNGKVDDISPCLYISDTFTNFTGSANVTVSNNHFYDCDRIGINFYADGGGAIIGNTFTNLKEGAINLGQGSQRVVVSGNKIRGITVSDIVGMGIEINQKNAPDGAIIITDNVIEDTGTCAIASNGQNNLIIAGNILKDAGGAATYPATVGPYMYARGIAASDPMPDEKRSAIRFATGDLYQSHNTVVSDNVITSDGATTQYALSFIAVGTPIYLHERIAYHGNLVEGMQQAEINPDVAANAGAGNVIDATQVIGSEATPTLNCLAGTMATFTATSASAWTAPDVLPPAGTTVKILITQDGTGGWAITWHADFIFPTAWTNTGNTAGKKSLASFVSDGTKLIAQGANVWY